MYFHAFQFKIRENRRVGNSVATAAGLLGLTLFENTGRGRRGQYFYQLAGFVIMRP